jgi:hypothetical protein
MNDDYNWECVPCDEPDTAIQILTWVVVIGGAIGFVLLILSATVVITRVTNDLPGRLLAKAQNRPYYQPEGTDPNEQQPVR